MVTEFGQLPDRNVVPISLILSGLVFAGAGGVNNLVQSNWIRDKGFGMGIYIPRIVSPITGEEVAAPATGSMVRQDEANLRRFAGWWKVANREQLVSFWFICIFSITVFSTLAYTTVPGLGLGASANLAFVRAEGEALKSVRRSVVRHVLLGLRRAVAHPRVPRRHRLRVAPRRRRRQDRVPAAEPALVGEPDLLRGGVGHDRRGLADPAVGLNQPLLLLTIAACLNGMVMFVYSILLIQLNRRGLPPAIRVKGLRLAMLVVATLFYGFFSGWLVIVQVQNYLAQS